MASKKEPKVSPVRSITIPRFTTNSDWKVLDIAVRGNKLAVSGCKDRTETPFIDLFTLNDPDSSSPLMTQLFTKLFNDPRWLSYRCVSFLDDSRIVTVHGDRVQVYHIEADDSEPLHTVNLLHDREASCVTVREGEIFFSLLLSNEVIVFDFRFNKIKTITLEGLEGYPVDITVYGDNVFISTASDRAIRYNMEGKIVHEYKAPGYSYPHSITVSGLVYILWDGLHVVVYSLSDSQQLMSFDVDLSTRIRIVDVNRLLTVYRHTGKVREYSMWTYPWLIRGLTMLLSNNDCHQLARHVALPKYQLDAIINSDSSAKDLLDILDERGVIHTSNVSRLLEAITVLKINEKALFMLEYYQRSRGDETSYGRFLAGLSSHLLLSLPRKLCDYFKFTNEKKKAVITSQTPGISFLLTLEDIGAINPLDVGKLVTPLKQYQLVQAVAKVQEYQTLVDERSELKKPINTLEGKQALFIECLRKKTKSWYETMTPLPWKKSCKWMTSELFIACGLVLTNSKAKMKITNVDPKCKLQYTDILTHERLKSATRIIIEGDPGSGKTMLSSQLAYDWSIGKSSDAKMVVFLPLKSVDGMTIIEAIKQFYIPKGKPLNEDDIEAILDQASDENKTCIVLDGLEEYNGRTKDGEPSEIVRVMRKEKFPNCTVVLTSRSDFVHGLPQCPMLKLGRFGEDERDQYIANIIPEDPQRQQKVKRNIETFALLNDLCSIPLLFVYIVHNIEHLGQIDKPKGQLDSVGPFMEVMVNILLSLSRSEGSEREIMSTRLSEIAFNGLCKGYQQLMWPKSFLDENVSNVKDWIESGILVVEEGEPTREKEHQKKGEAVDEGMVTKKEIISLDDERRQGESSSEAAMIEESSTDNKPRETEKPFTERKTSTDPQNLSLQVKFLHKVIQEWFAAKHFSSMLQRSKGQNRHRLFLDRQLPLINPADLHYVLRFTSYLCPENCYLIMKHLHSCYKSSMGVVPEYILNCIFLCFIECKSPVGKKKMEHAVRQVCENIVTIRGEDSRLLQQSKVSMLTYASKSEIRIGTLRLVDLVVEVTKATITFNSNITLECFPTLKVIEVSRWDMRLKEEDFEELIKFITQCKLLDKAFLSFPSPPPLLTDKKLLSSMKKNLTIEWIIGDRIVHTLDKKSGEWPMQFRSTPHQITDFSQPGPSKSSAHSRKTKKAQERTSTPKSGQKQDTEEPGSITTKKKHVNTGSQQIVQTPQITKAPQILTQGETAYQVLSKSLRVMLMINKEGGRLDIPDTGVSLEIPSGALEGEQLIQMIIIPHHFESKSLTFASNSSLVVELLPSNLNLLKPAILTLPHCLVLKKGCEWKAKIYRSHHKEGSEPQWEEQSNTHYKLGKHNCVIEIQRFSSETFVVPDKIVEAKNIIVFAAGRRGLTDSMLLDIGYYWNIASCEKVSELNNSKLLHKKPTVFYNDGKHLKISLKKFTPMNWTCSRGGKKTQAISFDEVAIAPWSFRTFVLDKTEPKGTDACICYCKAGQAPHLWDLVFQLKMERAKHKAHEVKRERTSPQMERAKHKPHEVKRGSTSPQMERAKHKHYEVKRESTSPQMERAKHKHHEVKRKSTSPQMERAKHKHHEVKRKSTSPQMEGTEHKHHEVKRKSTSPQMERAKHKHHEVKRESTSPQMERTEQNQLDNIKKEHQSEEEEDKAQVRDPSSVKQSSTSARQEAERVGKFTAGIADLVVTTDTIQPPDVLTQLHESLQNVFAEMTRSDSENLANFFMFPLKHVKAIVNSPSHSKDLLVELEKKGIIQSALTDEFSENLGALNILTKRSEGSKSSINITSSAHLMPMLTEGEEDWKPPDTMKITSSISGKGGLIQIPNTGIKLVFPPNAVTEEHNIQVKIIPPSLLNEPTTSFSSNSSVVVGLLPNGLQLKREVSLTLPHCLTFTNEEKAKAKAYVSHHEEGQRPRWEERPLSPYIFHRSKCTVRLLSFCWVKIVIDDKEVEAKNIVVFATKDILQNKKTANLEVGYYEDIPDRGEQNILELNPDMKPEKKMKLKFLKEGKQPLTVSFNGTDPGNTWAMEQDKPKKEISWQSIAGSEHRLVSFVLHRKQTKDSCCNVSAKQGKSDPVIFVLKLEVNLSTGVILDSKVPDSILKELARKLTREWQMLARELNISECDLYNIKENNTGNIVNTKYFMLSHWSEMNGTGATCRVLAEALGKVERTDLKDFVEKEDLRDQQIKIKHKYEDRESSSSKYHLQQKDPEDREKKRVSRKRKRAKHRHHEVNRESTSPQRKSAKHKHHKEKRKSTSPQMERRKHKHHKVKKKSVSPHRKRAKQYLLDDGEKEHQSEDDKAQAS